jgi:hypothetical protein
MSTSGSPGWRRAWWWLAGLTVEADGGEAEKRFSVAAFPRRWCAPMVGDGLEVLLQHEGSQGMRRGRRRRTVMTESVSSPRRGESAAVAALWRPAVDKR